MIFIALMLVLTLAAAVIHRLITRETSDLRLCMRHGMAGAFLFVGIDHLVTPERYLSMMPSYLPAHETLVVFTGLCEIAGAIGLAWPRFMKLAGLMLALYAIAVLPANLNNALNGLTVEGLPQNQTYYWVRLAFQPFIIAWSLYSAELIFPRSAISQALSPKHIK